MREDDAIVMDDMFPQATKVSLRPGAADFTTSITGTVETLMPYTGGTAQTLFAAAGTAFYNVTASGAVGAAVQSGLTNARWTHTNFATSSANWLIAANGVDKPRYWDGAAWVAVDGGSVPAITGVTTTTLNCPCGHKNRLWFLQVNTLVAWYLPTDAVGGAATAFPLRSYATRGGYLIAIKTWSFDSAGVGPDDYLTFFTSEGEVLLFKGTDPSAPATWALVGVYYIGKLVNERCITKALGDVVLLTYDGLYPLSRALNQEILQPGDAWSDPIRDALLSATQLYADNFGWQVTTFPDGNILLINVPVSSGIVYQFVMNLRTRRWARVTKWTASCLQYFNKKLYGGFSAKTAQLWTGNADFGSDIVGVTISAFSSLGYPEQDKFIQLLRLYYSGTGIETMLLECNTDFNTIPPSEAVFSTISVAGAVWGTAVWGASYWPAGEATATVMQQPGVIGKQIAIAIKVASKQTWSWLAAGAVFTVGETPL